MYVYFRGPFPPGRPPMKSNKDSHAGESETAHTLVSRPDLVHMDRATSESAQIRIVSIFRRACIRESGGMASFHTITRAKAQQRRRNGRVRHEGSGGERSQCPSSHQGRSGKSRGSSRSSSKALSGRTRQNSRISTAREGGIRFRTPRPIRPVARRLSRELRCPPMRRPADARRSTPFPGRATYLSVRTRLPLRHEERSATGASGHRTSTDLRARRHLRSATHRKSDRARPLRPDPVNGPVLPRTACGWREIGSRSRCLPAPSGNRFFRVPDSSLRLGTSAALFSLPLNLRSL